MYLLQNVIIQGFWGNQTVKCDLYEDVSIFIGYNGTGKTTLINLLQAALTGNVKYLGSQQFDKISLRLFEPKSDKTLNITVERILGDGPWETIQYKIGDTDFNIPLVQTDVGVHRTVIGARYSTEGSLQEEIEKYIQVSWLAVHRKSITTDNGNSSRNQRFSKVSSNPVDARMFALLSKLGEYHLTLQAEFNNHLETFQKRVLLSLLYDEKTDVFDPNMDDIDSEQMTKELEHAFEVLGMKGSGIKNRIAAHISKITNSIKAIKAWKAEKKDLKVDDVLPYPSLKRTRNIVELSNATDRQREAVFALMDNFVNHINDFLNEKKISLAPDHDFGLKITKTTDEIAFTALSSGEKQLIVLLAEAVLQKQSQSIFIADEPELSLHIEWQRKLLGAVRELNPNAQLIVATHSPQIAGAWKKKIIKMKEIVSCPK